MLRLVEINSKVKLDKMSTKDSQEFQDAMQAGQKGERSYGPNDFGLWFLITPSARTETPETGRGALTRRTSNQESGGAMRSS